VRLDDGGDGERPWTMGDPNWWNVKCPGELKLGGLGMKKVVNAYFNRPHEQTGGSYADEVGQTQVEVSMAGRVYLAESCQNGEKDFVDPGSYDDVQYSRIKLLGKKISYTMDFEGVGCGWDASLSLNAMPDNKEPTSCHDYFCDSMQTCGARCTEISLQEANMHAWFSTLHTANDGKGVGIGYGGGDDEKPRRDWNASKYGPDSECIDTKSPFGVSISFPVDSAGKLKSMDVELNQSGCKVSASIDEYPSRGGTVSMEELSAAMDSGMTLVFSLWGSPGMGWLDGKGWDDAGPCAPEDENPVTDTLADQDRVRWANFTIEDIPAQASSLTPPAGEIEPTADDDDDDESNFTIEDITAQASSMTPSAGEVELTADDDDESMDDSV